MSTMASSKPARCLTTKVGLQLHAVITYEGRISFPLVGGPIYTIVPLPDRTLGATFVATTFPLGPGIIMQGEWKLSNPLALDKRIMMIGFQLGTLPFNPLNVAPLIPPDSYFQGPEFFVSWVIINDGPVPPPGSPDVFIRFNTQMWTPKSGGFGVCCT